MIPYQYKPQLALRLKDDQLPQYHLSDDYASDIKLDGVRYVLHRDMSGDARAYSRGTSVRGGLVDKSGQLAHLLDDLKKYWPPGTVLDGEVFIPGIRKSFRNVTTISGSTPEEAKRRQERSGVWLQYYVFDILAENGIDYTDQGEALYQEDRWKRLRSTFGGVSQLNNLHICLPEYGVENKQEHLQICLANGKEGVILKQLNGLYCQDKRDKRWIKNKPQKDYQVVFMGVEWARLESLKKGDIESSPTRFIEMAKQHGFERIVGSITYGQLVRNQSLFIESGETIFLQGVPYKLQVLGSCSGLDDRTRLDITKNWQTYSTERRCFDIRAQNRHEGSMALREPQFDRWRDDLSYENCIVDETDE